MNSIPAFRAPALATLVLSAILAMGMTLLPAVSRAQDEEETDGGDEFKEAKIELLFHSTDSTRTLQARVTSDTVPVEGVEIHFYVLRLFRELALGYGEETDENGMAEVNFPMDLMGDQKGMLVVIARIEEDDTYGDVETQAKVRWGIPFKKHLKDPWTERSLSASRSKAPTYLIIASNLIIAVIWGTILYVIYLFFRIRRLGKASG